MQALTYIKEGVFKLTEKFKPTIQHPKDAIVRVTLSSIGTSDLHIKHGSVPKAVPGITVGHERVGIEEAYDLFENRRDNVIKVAITNPDSPY